MDKVHGKTNKLFDDIRKKKNMVTENSNKCSTKKDLYQIKDMPYKCIYCQKVFFNSKFLMKHLLRRHSDELVLSFKNLPGYESDNDLSKVQNFKVFLKEEFSSLKKKIDSTKQVVDRKDETDSCKENQTIDRDETIYTIRSSQNTSDDDVTPNEIRGLKEKLLDKEKDVQNLNDKFVELDTVLKNEVLMKQNINETVVLMEEKIMQAQKSQFIELRQILVSEFQCLFQSQKQENSELHSQLLELKHKLEKLDYAFNNVQQQCISTDLLKEEIKKEMMPHVIPHISDRKNEKKTLKISLQKSELSIDKSRQKSLQNKVSELENSGHRELNSKNFRNHCRVTSETQDELVSAVDEKLSQLSIKPHTIKLSSDELNRILTLLHIRKDHLSKKYRNFDEIYDFLNMQADQRVHNKLKYKKHHKIKFSEPFTCNKNSLNHSVTSFEDCIYEQSKLKSEKHHKNKFAEPLISSRISLNHSIKSLEDSRHEQSPIVQTVNKSFTSAKKSIPSDFKHVSENQALENESFIFPDKGASGDSIYQFSNEQNMSTIKQKFHSNKELETFSHVEGIQNSKDLNATFSKGSITVTKEPSKNKRQQNSMSILEQKKQNSAVFSHSVQFKETPIFKTSDELNKLAGCSKSIDDLDDISSLESYNSSDDDCDHIPDNL